MADDYAGWRPEPLPDGWSLIPTDRRRLVEDELAVEIKDGHVLAGKRLFAIAACNACDHTLVMTPTRSGRSST